jgi:hypothetical protein
LNGRIDSRAQSQFALVAWSSLDGQGIAVKFTFDEKSVNKRFLSCTTPVLLDPSRGEVPKANAGKIKK